MEPTNGNGAPVNPLATSSASNREALLRLTGLVPLASAAQRGGVTPATLRRHIHLGVCHGRKIGGAWYVNEQTIERWVRRHPRRTAGVGSRARTSAVPAEPCPCAAEQPAPSDEATRRPAQAVAADLEMRAKRAHAFLRLQEDERQLVLDVLGLHENADLSPECRAWLGGLVENTARVATATALDVLLTDLALQISHAPLDVLARLGGAEYRYAIELA